MFTSDGSGRGGEPQEIPSQVISPLQLMTSQPAVGLRDVFGPGCNVDANFSRKMRQHQKKKYLELFAINLHGSSSDLSSEIWLIHLTNL